MAEQVTKFLEDSCRELLLVQFLAKFPRLLFSTSHLPLLPPPIPLFYPPFSTTSATVVGRRAVGDSEMKLLTGLTWTWKKNRPARIFFLLLFNHLIFLVVYYLIPFLRKSFYWNIYEEKEEH